MVSLTISMEDVTMRQYYTIPTNRHVAICGMTRSGKSFLCEQYLAKYDYVVKLDTKNETMERRRKNEPLWADLKENVDFTVCTSFEDLDNIDTNKIIYVPSFEEQNEETYNKFFRWIYDRENTIVWIDELMSIGTANSYPIELKRLMIMGNSKNVACWCCTQRPSGIPNIVLANVTFIFVFNLNLPDDRKKLVQISGCTEIMEMPKGHNFWFYRMGDESATKARLVPKGG